MSIKKCTTVIFPAGLYLKVAELAVENRRSFTAQVVMLLEAQVGRSDDKGERASMRALTCHSETE
jgi:hypothetical protein